jgi:hypothetical protein
MPSVDLNRRVPRSSPPKSLGGGRPPGRAIATPALSPTTLTGETAAALAAHDAVFERFFAAIRHSCRGSRLWPLQVSAAVTVALEFAAAEPAAARLLTVDAITQDPALARHVLRSSDRLAQMLRSGRAISPAAAQLPALTEKALIGAAFAIASARLRSEKIHGLADLHPQLVELLLAPYVGAELATRAAAAPRRAHPPSAVATSTSLLAPSRRHPAGPAGASSAS